MKILHITPAYKPAVIYGGPTMSVALLCEELVKADVSIDVYTTTGNGPNELPVAPNKAVFVDGVAVTYFKRITKDHTHFSPALLQALWKTVKGFDVVHIHAWWNLVSVLSCGVAIARRVPVVISPRGMLSDYSFNNKNIGAKGIIHGFMGKRLLTKSHIHTTSAHETDAITKLVKPLSIACLPNFVKLESTNIHAIAKPAAILKLLFFSRIQEKKGLDILLSALKLTSVPYHLTIAGSGEENYICYLKTLAASIENKITWAGFFGDDKFDMIQQHDVLVLPSYDENFGNVVIESLSVGTAVLVSGQVGLADYVIANKLGWVCQTSAESVADAITDISKNKIGDLNRIRQIAPAMVRGDFTGSNLAQKYIALYKQIIPA
nr:glycosyltransferase [uncultured Mucilaginibacter sp.]